MPHHLLKKDGELKMPEQIDLKIKEKRGQWGNQFEFILTLIGYAVGIGNIWRFPYLCMKNGGGAFLIPYFIFLFIGGIPLFFMELYLGQFSSLSPIVVWKITPLFKGLGWSMCCISFIISLYYNIILSWILYFLGSSFTIGDLPWASCGNSWNTETCVDSRNSKNVTILNGTNSTYGVPNLTNKTSTTPAEEFWENNILGISDGIDSMGSIRWQNAVCLLVSWILVFCCMVKGIKTTGKVVYVTATLPYILLFALFVRGITLPGALMGIKYYIIPDWKRLLEPSIWGDACLQIFYSLGPGWGGLVTFSSFNKFNHNCLRDGILIPIVNCFTSFFGGFVVFSIIGFLSYDTGLPVDSVIKAGPGLAFIAYPSAIARMPFSPVWAIIFFITLLTIGIDSQFGMVESYMAGVMDLFPKLLKYKPLITGIICLFAYFCGLLFTTNAGMYYFQIVDWYSAMFSIVLIAILEAIAVAYIYGFNQVSKDLRMMLGKSLNWFMIVCWCGIVPILMTACLGYSVYTSVPPKYGDYVYPPWVVILGWCLASSSVIPIPVVAIIQLVKARRQESSFFRAFLLSLYPSRSWGPGNAEYRDAYEYTGTMSRFYRHKEKDASHIKLYPQV